MFKNRKKPTKGAIVFYSLYGAGVLAFLIALLVILNPLKDWLIRYEAAQPNHKKQEVYQEIFQAGNWEELYQLAGLQDSKFEQAASFAAYMDKLVGEQELVCLETSAGLSGDKKFIVKLGDEKIATFVLTGGGSNETEIIPWELKSVEVSLEKETSVTVDRLPGQTVYINGVALDDSYTIRRITADRAQAYLPEGQNGFYMDQQRVTGLWTEPKVEVKDAAGFDIPVNYNGETGVYTQTLPAQVATDAQKELALNAAKAYSKYMINADDHKLSVNFDTASEIYQKILTYEKWTMQSYQGYAFSEATYSDFYQYSEDCFSIVVDLTLNVTRPNGTVKEYPFHSTLVMTRNNMGVFKATAMTNLNIQEVREQVKLTLSYDETTQDIWVDTVNPKPQLPILTAPEGKVFKGWVMEELNENGTTLTVVFDENGALMLPADTALDAVTLKPLFEDGGNG